MHNVRVTTSLRQLCVGIENILNTNLEIASPVFGEEVELEEVERILGDGRTLDDRRPPVLHEGQKSVEKHPAIRILVHLVELRQRFRTL